jgi:hypothetical protein
MIVDFRVIKFIVGMSISKGVPPCQKMLQQNVKGENRAQKPLPDCAGMPAGKGFQRVQILPIKSGKYFTYC